MHDSFPPIPPESTRILLVDANLPLRELCAALLQRSGYQVDAEDDAEAGWTALRDNGYDLLVIDYRLPGGSGLRLIAKLRTAQVSMPVILISGTVYSESLNRNARLRISATINRPFTAEQLLETAVAVLQAANRAPAGEQPLILLACET